MKKLFLLALMVAAFSTNTEAEAKNSNLLNFQGTLKDAKNAVVSKNMKVLFKIYGTETGGVPVWTEEQMVTIEEGYFNVYLGAIQDFKDVNFSEELYLEITLGNGEVLPRTRLSASPFSFNAAAADTADVAKSVIDGVLKWKNFEPKELAAGGMLSGSYPNPTLNYEKVITGIPANSIDGSKIMPGTYPHINATPTGVAYGDMEGSVFPTLNLKKEVIDVKHIKKNAVTELAIKDGSVTEGKLASDAITSDKIKEGAVTEVKIASDAVTSDKIKEGAVTEVKIASDAVTSDKIKEGAITNVKLAENAVNSLNIVDGAVVNSKLGEKAVKTINIDDKAVTTEQIADAAVTYEKLAELAVSTENIQDTAVTSKKIATDAITSNKIADGAVIAGKLADDVVFNDNIKAGAVTADKISGDAADKSKVLQLDKDGKAVWGDIAGGLNQFSGNPTKEGQMFIYHNGEWTLTEGGVPNHNTVLKYSDIGKRYTWEKDSSFELPYINDDAKSDPLDEDLIRIKRTDERANKVMHLENSKSKGQEVLYVKGSGNTAHSNGVVNIDANSNSAVGAESTALNVSNFSHGVTTKTSSAIRSKNTVWDVSIDGVEHKGIESKIESNKNIGANFNDKGTTIALDGEAKGGNLAIGSSLKVSEASNAIGVRKNVTAKNDAWGTDATVTAKNRNAVGNKEAITGKLNATGTDATITAETGDAKGDNITVTGKTSAEGRITNVTATEGKATGSTEAIVSDKDEALGRGLTVTAKETDKKATGSTEAIVSEQGDATGREIVVTTKEEDKTAIGNVETILSEQGDALGRWMEVTAQEVDKIAFGNVETILSEQGDATGREIVVTTKEEDKTAIGNVETILSEKGEAYGKLMYVTSQGVDKMALGIGEFITSEKGDAMGIYLRVKTEDNTKNTIGADIRVKGGASNIGIYAADNYFLDPTAGVSASVYANSEKGNALFAEGTPEVGKDNYVAQVKATNNGRSMYIEGGDWNRNLIKKEAAGEDKDNAALVVRANADIADRPANVTAALGTPAWAGYEGKTAIKTYGDIWANSAIGATTIVGLEKVVVGTEEDKLTIITPPTTTDGSVNFDRVIEAPGAVFNGTDEAKGGIKVVNGTTETFKVTPDGDVTAHDATINGTLDVTGTTAFTGKINAKGGIEVKPGTTAVFGVTTDGDVTANDLTVNAVTASGEVQANGGLKVDDKFAVADGSGNITAGGTAEFKKNVTIGAAGAGADLSVKNGNIKVTKGTTENFTVDNTGNVVTKGTITQTHAAANAVGTTEAITGQVNATGTDATITAEQGEALGRKMTVIAQGVDKEALGSEEYITSEQGFASGKYMLVTARAVNKIAQGSEELIRSEQGEAKGRHMSVIAQGVDKEALGSEEFITSDKGEAFGRKMSVTAQGVDKEALGSRELIRSEQGVAVGRKMFVTAKGVDKKALGSTELISSEQGDALGSKMLVSAIAAGKKAIGSDIRVQGDAVIGVYAADNQTLAPKDGVSASVYANAKKGNALYAEGTPDVAENNYVAQVKATNNGRSMYIEGGDWNRNLIKKEAAGEDKDNAALVVRANPKDEIPTNVTAALATPAWAGSEGKTAIKTYGDIWASSAIGATTIVGLEKVVVGTENKFIVTHDGNVTAQNLTVNGAIKYSVSSEITDVANLKVANASITPTVVQLGTGIAGTVTSVQLGNPATGVGTIKYIINNSGATLTIAGATVANGKTATVICTTADDTNPVWTVIAVTP